MNADPLLVGLNVNSELIEISHGMFQARYGFEVIARKTMMMIPFDEPIWRRLYGPYGVEDIDEVLMALEQKWDAEVSEHLYWERLHHQDDLYPVTYAALPWLWEMSKAKQHKDQGLLLFLSHVCYCAMVEGGTGCDGQGPRGKFRGLSINFPTINIVGSMRTSASVKVIWRR